MKQWFYAEQGQQQGPVPEDRIVEMLRSGQLPAATRVWTAGHNEWTPARKIEKLAPPALSPPPIPAPAPKTPAQRDAPPVGPMFLHIPIGRLAFMSIISAGLYDAYWIYKNWRYVKERDGLTILPFWRGIFGIFFVYGILKTIRNDEQTNRLEQATFSAGRLAIGWIILILVGAALGGTEIWLNALGMMIASLSFLFCVPVQIYINRVNRKINLRPPYTPWSWGHMVCLVLGILNWLLLLAAPLVLAGIMLPE